MSKENDSQLVKASTTLSQRLGIEPDAMLETIKQQCFRDVDARNVSNAQLATFVNVAKELDLNPLLPGMMYAYPQRNGGITPMIGPDGTYKLLSERPDIDSWEVEFEGEGDSLRATAKIYRTGKDRPLTKTVWLKEWKVGSNPNWNTRPMHMLEIRALKQCARQVIHGMPLDEDERAIMESHVGFEAAKDVTPTERPKPPTPAKGVAAAKEAAKEAEPEAAKPEKKAPAKNEAKKSAAKEEPEPQPEPEPEVKDAEAELVQDNPEDDAESTAPLEPITMVPDSRYTGVRIYVEELKKQKIKTTSGGEHDGYVVVTSGQIDGRVISLKQDGYDILESSFEGKNPVWIDVETMASKKSPNGIAILVNSVSDSAPEGGEGESQVDF